MSENKKGAKFGRGARSPSSKHYRMAQRWEINKAKRIKRDIRLKAKAAIRKIMRMPSDLRVVHEGKLQELRHTVSQNRTG